MENGQLHYYHCGRYWRASGKMGKKQWESRAGPPGLACMIQGNLAQLRKPGPLNAPGFDFGQHGIGIP